MKSVMRLFDLCVASSLGSPIGVLSARRPIALSEAQESGSVVPVVRQTADKRLADARRAAKNTRYDKRAMVPEGPCRTSVIDSSHWWEGLSAIPVAQSDVIVVGRVTDAEAFLSNDRQGIYSEFTIEVEATLKNNAALPAIPSGGVVYGERDGGSIKCDDGTTFEYQHATRAIPQVGVRYVFFLKRNPDYDFTILVVHALVDGLAYYADGTFSAESHGWSEKRFVEYVRRLVTEQSR